MNAPLPPPALHHPLPERRRLAPWQRHGSWLLASLCLAGCGGGSDGSGLSNPVAPGLVEPLAGPAVRVEVSPVALLLTDNGQQQRLSVRAFDQDDREVKTAVTWEALRPAQVGVATDGTVRANTAVGSGQVVAIVDGVRSASVLVSVVQLAPGVTLINDAQIGSVPVAVDPLAEPDTDNPYEVLLTGIAAPAPGTLLLGREGQVIGGEVLESRVEAGGVRVRLKTVPIDRLVVAAEIQEEIDLKGLPLQVPPEIAALYDVRLEADEYIFTPRPGVAATSNPVAASVPPGQPGQKRTLATTDGRKGALALREFKLGPFKCEVATPQLPLSLTQPAQFSLKFVPGYLVDYSRATGLKRLLFKAEASFKMKANLQVNAGGLLNLTCESTLVQRLVPLPGVAGLLLGGELKAGLGFETEGSIAIPLLGAELVAEAKGTMEAGLDCTTGTCRVHSLWKPETSNTLRFITPDGALANSRSEFFLFGYGVAKLKVGLTLVSAARVDVVTVRGGLKFETSLAPEATQLAPVEAGQPDYRSDYKLQALAEVAAGSVNKGDNGLRKLLQKLGMFKVTLLKVQLSLPLGGSPKGSATVDNGDFARDGAFVEGKRLGFRVKLDPPTTSFPLLGYNVRRVRILFTTEGLLPREVASVEAQPGQTEFDLSWIAEGTAGATGRGFSAFVDTVLPVPVGLELNKVQVLPPVLRGRLLVTELRHQPFEEATALAPFLAGLDSRLEWDGQVELRPDQAAVVTAENASFTEQFHKRSRSAFAGGGPTGNCRFQRVTEFFGSTSGSGSGSLIGARVSMNFADAGARWELFSVSLQSFGTSEGTTTESIANISGDCSGVNPTGSGPVVERGAPFGKTVFIHELNAVRPLSGPVVTGPDGRRSIQFSGPTTLITTATGSSQTTTVALDLQEGPSTRASTDLSVALVARPTVQALGSLTYSVNLQNLGAGPATEVRTEFSLPPGWLVRGQTGWSACAVSLNSVVCRTDRLEAGERRAFLEDVTAPAALGQYTTSARVSAAEFDTDFSNNHTETTSTIVE